ncbi:hypothetical protein OHT57_31145 [Streptomyces sp. NBC_00285]|uniref:hypothetical protein n=1 Tax=Streptomyces sp. NBC_00285 TaxID=2975700 RepID=UPI002E2B53E2|nr:hypothetical protein [Streptomyces sp. NBC_00285]
MFTHTELPGFPPPLAPPERRKQPICFQCRRIVVPDEPEDWAGYQPQHLQAWEATLSSPDPVTGTLFPDPLGKEPKHHPECEYRELPPVVMWFMDKPTALIYRQKLWEARRRSTE